jgi:hypothetical protein
LDGRGGGEGLRKREGRSGILIENRKGHGLISIYGIRKAANRLNGGIRAPNGVEKITKTVA